MKKNICCGKAGGPAGLIGLPGSGTDNGDNILNTINQIANVVNPSPQIMTSMSTVGMPPNKNEICDKGEPYVLNGVPQTCTSTVCPNKFHCVFSKRGKNYYCCSKDGAGNGLILVIL